MHCCNCSHFWENVFRFFCLIFLGTLFGNGLFLFKKIDLIPSPISHLSEYNSQPKIIKRKYMSHFNKSLNYTVLTYSTFSFISSVFVLKFSTCITEHKMSLKILRMKFSEYSIGDRIDILSRNPVNVIARLFSRSQLECNNVILFMTCKKMTSLYFSVFQGLRTMQCVFHLRWVH